MTDLTQRSIEVIESGQHPGGAFVACPIFSQYGYCWLRDGTWVAFAMDCVGEHDSARRFYQWVGRTLHAHSEQAEALFQKLAAGETIHEADYLPTRFTLTGEIDDSTPWENFQLDGYGTWLWGLAEHIRLTGDQSLWADVLPAVELTVRYLEALWQVPNYDCWEEHRDHVHPATLAAIYGGLRASALVSQNLLDDIQTYTRDYAVTSSGTLMKFLGNDAVDASLLWAAVPYGLFDLHDPIFQKTLVKIESDICRPGGGVYRYREDTYYGGGEWLLLAAWLGWVYVELDRLADAHAILEWIEAQASDSGQMPEQVSDYMLHPERFSEWEARWGTVANPLLWSHAMYLILKTKLDEQHAHS